MLLTGFAAGALACNCWVVAPHPGADALVVDPGQRAAGRVRRVLDTHRLTPAAVLLTHGHIDHLWQAQKVADTYGCPVYIHPEDRFMLTDPVHGLGPRLGQVLLGALFREPRQVVEFAPDGEALTLAGMTVTAHHTPGHTRGSMCFATGDGGRDVVFTGDTLLPGTVGRTDLFGGSGRDLLRSIVGTLLPMPDATEVLPGHGAATTIGAERRDNPFLQGLIR